MCLIIKLKRKEKEIKPFKLENLPKDVKEKISNIEFNQGKIFIMMGWVRLKDDYVFEYDNTRNESFYNKKDLIGLVRHCTIQKKRKSGES